MSKKIVKPISSNIAYHPSAQIFSLLTQEKEIQLAKQIEHHYKKILWVAAQCPNALDVLHTHFQKIIQGKVKLNSFVSGLVFEEHFANTQRPACNLKTLQSKMTSLSVLQSLLKEQIQVFGRDHKTALATQKSLAEYLNIFKWTSTMIERLVQAIQSLADDSGIPQIKRLKLNLRLAFESFNAAKKELFEGSLRLVFSIAQKYHFKGLDYRVLIQQGAIGLNKAIERFQQIQEQWKQIGITRHHEDRKLWQALQEYGKVIFDKRRDNQQQARQLQDSNIAQAKGLCERITQLAKLPDEELTHSAAAFEQLQNEFKAIKDIPEKLQTAIKKQFFTACDAYHQQLRGISAVHRHRRGSVAARRCGGC